MGNAPQDVTIEKVLSTPGAPWGGDNGKTKMRTYDEVMFANDDRVRKVYVPVGVELAEGRAKGWFNDAKGTFTVASDDPPQTSGGGSNGGGKNYDRSPDHPVQMQRALHTSALSTALPLIEQMLTLSLIDKPADKDAYLKLVEGVATWVESTYPKAVLEQAAKADAA